MFCPEQNSKYKIKQRAITLKLGKEGLLFLCNALLLIEIYLPIQFQFDTFYSSQVKSRTRNLQRTNCPTDQLTPVYMYPLKLCLSGV